jgi:AAA family ATP:ADP antiporter
MLRNLASRFFDIRKGEFKISLLMFLYIFIVIAVLLIVKPTMNALFLSELGPEQLPLGFVLVAFGAIASSFVYSRLLSIYSLRPIIAWTLVLSSIISVLAALLLFLGQLKGWMLYFFYAWVAIYGVLSASQFWVLANLVFNIRDAKRLFGFIGSGAILGGLFGGYMTSLFAPVLGNDFMIVLASIMLLSLLPLLNKIWKARINDSVTTKSKPKKIVSYQNPFQLVKNSKHLTNLALLVGISVLVAKLVDYLFSDYASSSITDPDELSSFFGFWLSTFSLISLGVQLFMTQRIVGIWGVGFSLLLLPLGILFGSVFYLFLPELSAVVVIKAMDGVLKQSVNKSAFELLALPLPFDLKNKTKSFIDVVVDSLATGIAGLMLIFLIKGFELEALQITWLIIVLVSIWAFLIFKVRNTYYETFKNYLKGVSNDQATDFEKSKKVSVVDGMRQVFAHGSERQILFMLDKLMEINDKRFVEQVRNLLEHPSIKVKTAAIKNLYFLDSASMPSNIQSLLDLGDEDLNLAVMDFLLLHCRNEPDTVFNHYLDFPDTKISEAALFSLAKESIANLKLQQRYHLEKRLEESSALQADEPSELLLKTLGVSKIKKFDHIMLEALNSKNGETKLAAIEAIGLSQNLSFVEPLLRLFPRKEYRKQVMESLKNYDSELLPFLTQMVRERKIPLEIGRFVPKIMAELSDQDSVIHLFELFEDVDLSVRLEVVRSLSNLRTKRPGIKFNRFKVVSNIFEECKLYRRTLAAMHTQIIISFRNRKRFKPEVFEEERDARASLLELLERRLDAGLERIFKLLGLKYPQEDVLLAYDRLVGTKEEERAKAIDFLDNLLTGNLKRQILPLIEEASTDFSNEEAVQRITPKIPNEQECFELLLDIPDLKLQLAVLYLMRIQGDAKYLPILQKLVVNESPKIRTFAQSALDSVQNFNPF